MAQRLGEWLADAPQIEEDMALGNIALDLLGQARAFLTHAGELSEQAGGPAYTEDDLAYWRDERDFTNVQLVEQPRGDFAVTMVRLLVLSTWQLHLYRALCGSTDPVVAAVAAKAVKEVDYHQDHARQWTLRLGLGTDVSRARMVAALDAVAPYVLELFDDDPVAESVAAQGIGVRPSDLRPAVERRAGRDPGRGRPDPARDHLAGARWPARAALRRHGPSAGRAAAPGPLAPRGDVVNVEAPRQTALEDLRLRLEAVPDPELPVLTLGQLGVVRDVRLEGATAVVEVTPTYSGCPAMAVIVADLAREVRAAGYDADVRTVLSPAWTTDWISAAGRKALADNGIAPPAATSDGPVDVTIGPTAAAARLPAVRLGRRRGAGPLRLDRLQGAVALPGLPRAVRLREAAVTQAAADRDPGVAPRPVARADRLGGRAAHRRRGRRDPGRAARAGGDVRLLGRPAPHPASGGRRRRPAPVVLDLRLAGVGAEPPRRSRSG